MRRPITVKDAARFFLPLIFMTELNMISKSVIHAFLARLAAPKIVLAAFSTSFAFYYTVASGTEVSGLISISYLRDRRCIAHLLGFFCLLLAIPVGVAQIVAWTPVGDWLYGEVFGASAEVTGQARWATFYLSLSAPVLLLRALAFGLIMINRRTILITFSTLLRLLSLAVSLVVLPLWLEGASVGAAALVTCMAVETAFAWGAAARYFRALPAREGDLPRYGELWRFCWPLMLNQSSEMGVVMAINVFLGRLATPDLALAAFGVVHGLANLLLSPVRNLLHTAQTLARTRADVRVMVRFAGGVVAFFTLLVGAIFLSPLRGWVLTGVMGLTAELAAYSAPAVMIAFLVAGFWGYSALFRGLLAGARRTTAIAASAGARLAIVTAAGSVTFFVGGLNGAVFGVVAWALTLAAEATILGAWLSRGRGKALFPAEATRASAGN